MIQRVSYKESNQAANKMILNVPKVQQEFGRVAFSHYAPTVWNKLHEQLHLEILPTVGVFKGLLQQELQETCNCFG